MSTQFVNETIKYIGSVINDTSARKLSFYNDVTSGLVKLFKNEIKSAECAIFFLEENEYTLKSFKNEKKFVKDYLLPKGLTRALDDLIKSNKNISQIDFEGKFYLISKLMIDDSVFGIIFLGSSDKFKNETFDNFAAIANVISYKIKDYELSVVYKMQLNALQEAIQDKDCAYKIIKKQHKKLEKLDKTKNLFLANISHELRTPLNAIIGFSQALDAQIFGKLNDKQSEYIKDIQISGLHLLGMINEILDISKLEANAMKFSPDKISSTRAIKEVINILEPLYKNKNIDVIFDDTKDIDIMADNQKFQQILYNLLSNSIKFTPDGGKIYIIHDTDDKNYILKIKDTGIGIDKKYHNKIFKKYVHLSNSSCNQNSTGLGLPITKELVKLHNGKITLISELNKGATFEMEFNNIVL